MLNDLVASALIVQNVVDMLLILHQLVAEGYAINAELLATLLFPKASAFCDRT